MLKLIIFDLDGVLVDARELHYEALNQALSSINPKYIIGREEHLSTFDGLPTIKKLKMLTKCKQLPVELYDEVWRLKQEKTIDIISNTFEYDERIRSILLRLRQDGYILAVASNSIRETVNMMLIRKGFAEYFHFFYSNQDVRQPKPNTEMFLQCMIKAGVSPKETLIIEDSHIGRKSAFESGAQVLGVLNSSDITYDKIDGKIKMINAGKISPKWQGNDLNILIPMAGSGKRFQQKGYTFPKPLIDIGGKPMIQVIVENLNIEANYIFIVQKEHYEKYNLKYLLNLIASNCTVMRVDEVTEGAACTTLLAKKDRKSVV